jgi:hypothetical protein
MELFIATNILMLSGRQSYVPRGITIGFTQLVGHETVRMILRGNGNLPTRYWISYYPADSKYAEGCIGKNDEKSWYLIYNTYPLIYPRITRNAYFPPREAGPYLTNCSRRSNKYARDTDIDPKFSYNEGYKYQDLTGPRLARI